MKICKLPFSCSRFVLLFFKMGDITIKIPQKINRAFRIDDRRWADEIIADLERRSTTSQSISSPDNDRLLGIRVLARDYRANPGKEIQASIDLAETWRKKWDR